MFLLPGDESLRRDAGVAFEESVEMTLVGKTGFKGDFGKGFFLRD